MRSIYIKTNGNYLRKHVIKKKIHHSVKIVLKFLNLNIILDSRIQIYKILKFYFLQEAFKPCVAGIKIVNFKGINEF
jgi:hypothetical protein